MHRRRVQNAVKRYQPAGNNNNNNNSSIAADNAKRWERFLWRFRTWHPESSHQPSAALSCCNSQHSASAATTSTTMYIMVCARREVQIISVAMSYVRQLFVIYSSLNIAQRFPPNETN